MAIELDLQIHNKKRIAIMGGLLMVLSVYALSDISSQPSREPYVAAKASVNNKDAPASSSAQSGKAAQVVPLEAGNLDQMVAVNPFIELKEFDPEVQNIADMTSTNSNEKHVDVYKERPSSIPLPAIPNYNGHSSYQENPQSISTALPERQISQPVTVQGVGTGDNGNNIAILSDGRVVSEGDTYNDDRIAYIGGDGITFDNGEKLQYK